MNILDDVKILYHQLSHGCCSLTCKCKYCASCKEFIYPYLGDEEYLQIAKRLVEKKQKEYIFCDGISPLLLHPEYEGKISSYNQYLQTIIKNQSMTDNQYTYLKGAFTNKDIFSFLLRQKSDFLTKEDLSIDETSVLEIRKIFESNPNVFRPFKGDYLNLLKEFGEIEKTTTYYLRGVFILSIFIEWCDDPQNFFNACFKFKDTYTQLLSKFPYLFRAVLNFVVEYTKKNNVNIYYPVFIKNMYITNEKQGLGIPKKNFTSDKLKEFLKVNERLCASLFKDYSFMMDESTQSILEPQNNLKELRITVGRDSLIEDTFHEFETKGNCNLSNTKLVINFRNEIGIDIGGLFREFISLFSRKAFLPEYGNFIKTESGNVWFNNNSFATPLFFKMIGKVMGYAFSSKISLNVHFPLILYKRILNKEVNIEDLKEIDPETVRSIQSISEMIKNGEDISKLYLTFTASYYSYGNYIDEPIFQNGDKISVTNSNFEFYKSEYIHWLTYTSIQKFLDPLKEGFLETSGISPKDENITPEFISYVIGGNETIDWNSFRESIECIGWGNNASTLNHFWDIFSSWTEDQKRKLLMFITGSPTEPIAGFKSQHIQFICGKDKSLCPVAHTCVNQFILPDYDNYDILSNHLNTCIENSETFGLY